MLEVHETMDIVAVEARNSLDFVDEVFGLYEAGVAFAVCRPHIALEEYPGLNVVQRIATAQRHGWAAPRLGEAAQSSSDAIAQIVFSSGTEGRPKAIALSRRALADVEDRLIAIMEIDASIREYIGVPVTYSFGLGRARVVARAGGAFYLPDRFDPVEIRDLLAKGEINAISAVPSLWRVLLANPDFLGHLGARVRWIEIGSQYMSGDEKAALREMFPQARIVQHYGLTEASRSTFLVVDQASPDRLDSVGHALGAVEVRIGDEGEICIRGPHVASGIYDEEGGLVSLLEADGWLHTRDRGELVDGCLYYRGRLDDQINLAGIKVAAESLEQDVAALVPLEAGHFALSSVQDPLRGETVLLAHDAVAAPQAAALQAALVRALAAKGVQAGSEIRILALDELPRTDTGKIQRKQLRAMWEGQADPARPGDDEDAAHDPVRSVFRRCFPSRQIDDNSSFVTLDGDSLSYINFVLGLERLLGPLPEGWETMSVAELAALAQVERKPSRWVTVEPNVFVRAAAPIMVVANHAGIGEVSGGATILMIVAGQNFVKFGIPDLSEGRAGKVLKTFVISVLLPFWLILIAYQSLRGKVLLQDVLLFKNFTGTPGIEPFQTWFIDALSHAVLLMALLSLFPAVRRTLKTRPERLALAILAAAVVVALTQRFFLMDVLDNLGRETTYVFWMFALGLCVGVVTSTRDKAIVLLTAVVMGVCIYWTDTSRMVSVSAGTLLLLLNYRIPVPRFIIPVLTVIGSSSLFIYMTHGRAPVHSPTADWPVDVIRIGVGVLLGIVTYFVYDWVALRARRMIGWMAARRRSAAGS